MIEEDNRGVREWILNAKSAEKTEEYFQNIEEQQ